jgi:hypothetical protein
MREAQIKDLKWKNASINMRLSVMHMTTIRIIVYLCIQRKFRWVSIENDDALMLRGLFYILMFTFAINYRTAVKHCTLPRNLYRANPLKVLYIVYLQITSPINAYWNEFKE